MIEEILQLVAVLANGEFPIGEIEVFEVDLVLAADLEVFRVEIEVVKVLVAEVREIIGWVLILGFLKVFDLGRQVVDFLDGPAQSEAE